MYSFEVPKEYLGKLVELREKTGKPIRRQICAAIEYYLKMAEQDPMFADQLLRDFPEKYRRQGST